MIVHIVQWAYQLRVYLSSSAVSLKPPLPNGVSSARTKKKLWSCFRKGTLNTAAAAEEVLEDMACGVVCSATDIISDAADGTDDDDDSQNSSQKG